ncbi:hypothetical protein Scep_018479 [Stephania cephalantha]|uniref:Rhamnogalacturonan endolyase n=1 Tax=Stephania cephalantha TaxID=152367 RepID=A0AAP0I963_9MAGN
MPTEQDRQRGQTLDYKEAVLLTNPRNPELRGQVDDKYQFATEAKDSHVHGWISDELKAGLWMITPSNEFRNGGPIKQELTSHLGPTMLAIFMSDHYLGKAELKFGDGEYWKKVLGPVFVYLNRVNDDSADARSDLWEDAKAQMRTEVQKWPYSFPVSGDFAHADQRGSVTGRLLVRDRFAPEELTPANSAYIGVAPPGEPGSWQTEGKGYQFWTRTDADGNFNISNVREGDYNLYGWVPGFIGDYTNGSNLHISPGNEINLGDIVYEPPRDGPTLWEIGIPDRSAAEFFIPEPSPKYATKLSNAQSNSTDEGKFRQYGLWERYTELYPDNDLVYTVGVSDWRKDWFFAQVTRKNETDNSFEPTTWQVVFNLSEVVSGGTYKLRVAVAGATFANLQVRVNYPPTYRPLLETRMIGRDNAIARHGIHGEYKLYTADIPSYLLRPGSNTVYLYQNRNYGPFVGIMYDYLRLEAPTTAAPPPQKRFVETGVDPIVKLAILDHNVVMDNGFVRINLTKPDGLLSEIYYYNSSVNLLQLIEEDGGGYWDTVWLESNGSGQTGHRGIFDIIKGIEFVVIKQDENQIELSFKRTWDPSRGQGLVPLNIDKRFIMLSGSHGFYSYEILEHLQGWPAFAISEFRLALKLNRDK